MVAWGNSAIVRTSYSEIVKQFLDAMKPSPPSSDSGMVLRSSCSKCCGVPAQTTIVSRRPVTRSSVNQYSHHERAHHHSHHDDREHNHKNGIAESHHFEPVLSSTPAHRSVSQTNTATFGNSRTIEGILSTGRNSKGSRISKKVHFETDTFGADGPLTFASDGSEDEGFGFSTDVKSEWTTTTSYTSSWASRTQASQNGHLSLGDRCSSTSEYCYGVAMPRPARRSHVLREVYSSDEEGESAADGGGSFVENNCRPVYIIQDASSSSSTPKARGGGAGPKRSSSVGTSSGFLSTVPLFVWTATYRAVCSVLLLDAWLLSRLTERQKRRTCALALLLLPLFLIWAVGPSEGSSSAPGGVVSAATTAATSARDSAVKATGAVWNALIALPSLAWRWSPWGAGGSEGVAEERTVEGKTAAPRRRPEEELRRMVRDVVAEQLERWESRGDRMSRDQHEAKKPNSEVEEYLKTRLADVAERTEDTSSEVLLLRTKIEELGAATDELRLAKEELQKRCRGNAELLEDLDSKIAAAVLRELDWPAAPTSKTAFHRWVLDELSVRDSRLHEALADLRSDVSAAAVRAREAERESREAGRAAKEAAAAATSAERPPGCDADVRKVVKEALSLYDADKTGMADYALESAGGSVVNTRCTEAYSAGAPMYHVFGIPIWRMSRTPRSAIQPNTSPGECWAFRGSQGHLVVQLSASIRPTGFTVEHIPKSLDPSGSIDSAPKEFTMMGLKSEADFGGEPLGKYVYREDGEPLQYFPVEDPDPGTFRFVEMLIHSNHGNPEYTCLYRLRVHGVPSR